MSHVVAFKLNDDELDVTLEQAAQGAYNAFGSNSNAPINIFTWDEFSGCLKLAAQRIPEFDRMTRLDQFKNVRIVFTQDNNEKAVTLLKELINVKAHENQWPDGRFETDEGKNEIYRYLLEGAIKYRGYTKRVSLVSDNHGLNLPIQFGIPVMTFVQNIKHIYNLWFYCMSRNRVCWSTQATPHAFSTWLLMPKNSDGRGTPLNNHNLEHFFEEKLQKMSAEHLELEMPHKFSVDPAEVKIALNKPICVEVLGVEIQVRVNGDFWIAAVVPAANRPILKPNATSNAVPPLQHAAHIKLKRGRIVQYAVFDACGINEPFIGIEDASYTQLYCREMNGYIRFLKDYIARTQGMAICDNIFKEQGDRKELLNGTGGGARRMSAQRASRRSNVRKMTCNDKNSRSRRMKTWMNPS